MSIDADLPRDRQGRLYHLRCGPGDLAPYILTCGDPDRARRIARCFDRLDLRRKNREFLTYTGFYHNIPVSVIATGIGAAASAIAVVEAAQCVAPSTFIRMGSTGALQDYINLGDLVITEQAYRDEDTTAQYAPSGGMGVPAHPLVLAALQEAAAELKVPHWVGATWTTSDFYAGQGRRVPGFPTRDPGKLPRLSDMGILNLEMEMSAYLTLAQISTLDLRAGGACAVFVDRINRTFASARLRRLSEQRLIAVGLRAVEILAQNEGVKG